MEFGEAAIRGCDWGSFEVCATTGAEELGPSLRRFINSKDSEEARNLWARIENVAFAQNTIYGAAEPTIEVLLAALVDTRPVHVRRWIVELLRFLLSGGSLTDPDLGRRCHDKARSGLWLLAGVAKGDTGLDREAALEVIALIDPQYGSQWTAWLEADDSDDGV